MKIFIVESGSTMHSSAMSIDKIPTQHTGHNQKPHGDRRNPHAPRQQPGNRVVKAHEPVQRSQRQEHDRHYGVAPAGNQFANTRHQHQITKANQTCSPAAQSTYAGKPETDASPESIASEDKGQVRAQQKNQRSQGQVNHDRVKGMTGNGHSALHRVAHNILQSLVVLKNGCSRPAAHIVGLCVGALLLTGCAGPQSALDPAGESAQLIAWLWWGMFGFFSLVLVVVVALWIYAMRRKSGQYDEQQAHKVHRRWVIGGGLILPIVSVTAVLAFGIPVGQHLLLLGPEDEEAMLIEVTGHRFWWEIRYPDGNVITANRMVLPVDVVIDVAIASNDVIHSFWIPRLAGKVDAIPGRTNRMRLKATSTGPMRGQCAEFCGLGHAHMILAVEVMEQDDFQRWLQQRQAPAQVRPEHEQAVAVFQQNCGDCHRVNGISEGERGPDLSDIASRPLVDLLVFKDQPPSIEQWLTQPSTAKWSENSPDHSELVPEHLPDIAAWLETLGR